MANDTIGNPPGGTITAATLADDDLIHVVDWSIGLDDTANKVLSVVQLRAFMNGSAMPAAPTITAGTTLGAPPGGAMDGTTIDGAEDVVPIVDPALGEDDAANHVVTLDDLKTALGFP